MRNCEWCLKKNLWTLVRWENNKRLCKCRNCGHLQYEEPAQGLKIPPKILYLDIETAFMSVDLYDLRIHSGYVNRQLITRHSFVINWAAAWLDKDYQIKGRIMSGVVTHREARRRDDRRIIETIWDLMDKADYIAGHNAKNFDIKKLKWRFMVYDMGFPLECKKLDSLIMAKAETSPASRGLEDLSIALGGVAKKSLSVYEWKAIVARETKQADRERLLRKANRYCQGDVREGVKVLRHYAKCIESSGRTLVK